ncbi:oligouridylate-binding protein 1 isoform X1 [Selaginella moellendorffii]|uniref:oligouridylate-binding protein 1 isoform X1 n=1 Tax=Selaginella moellendorffii TaxID=88036 RepID=UPI000D1C995C|nr:oligouridylate-binding protein 1 isoform X1 [Selaginella moellendorffii]|eukprot:XP_024514811.1 oligouridylate-binding protein 1 isoform X1 [Selaginella moellendorffii]
MYSVSQAQQSQSQPQQAQVAAAQAAQQQLQLQQQQLELQQWKQALMQQAAVLQQQQPFLHPGLITAMSQIEPIPSGNLPPGFDATSCRSVYVGNIHIKVTEALLAEVFATVGPLEGCKLIKKEKVSSGFVSILPFSLTVFRYLAWQSSYGFVDYFDHRSAAAAIITLNGKLIFGQSIKVNWAYASGQREDTTGHYNIFVGDLSPEVTDATLYAAFFMYPGCSDARVMWDQRSGRSRGYGFVSFRSKQEAERAINEMNGKWLGSRPIRCNWATKSTGSQEDVPTPGPVSVPEQVAVVQVQMKQEPNHDEQHEDGAMQLDGPENNPQFTTVYVGNLAHEVTQTELHRQFHALGVGVIEDVRVQKEKGFGFVRYRTHEEAAYAIQAANGRVICGKSVKCSWGSKPTPAGASSNPLPPPPPVALPLQSLMAAGMNQAYSAADLLAYQRLSQSSGTGQALLPLPQQGTSGSRVFDGIQPSAAAAAASLAAAMGQQHMFY